MGPAGFGPATKRIWAQIQYGYNFSCLAQVEEGGIVYGENEIRMIDKQLGPERGDVRARSRVILDHLHG